MLFEFASQHEFAAAIAADVVATVEKAIADKGYANIAISGGNTPEIYYPALNKAAIDWAQVRIFFADERMVPVDSKASNYGLAVRRLLNGHSNVKCWPVNVDLSVAAAAADYEAVLKRELPLDENGVPILDLVILGVGGDGHVASLFDVSSDNTRITTTASASGFERVSVSMAVLLAARRVIVAVSDHSKAHIIERMKAQPSSVPAMPVDMLRPDGSRVLWFTS